MCIPACAKADGARVVLVIANYLSIDDMASAGPTLHQLTLKGDLALINTGARTGVGLRYIAVGAGARLRGADGDPLFHDADEIVDGVGARDIYAFQTGKRAPLGSAVCLGLVRAAAANAEPAANAASFGLLGNVFHAAGLRTAVAGNSDLPLVPSRNTPLIVMDRDGMVDAGMIGNRAVRVDPDSPSGISDDLASISDFTNRSMNEYSLVAAELGDFNRLESSRFLMSDNAYAYSRAKNLRRLDQFIASILPEVERQDATLIICSPCRAESKGYMSNLAPLLIYRKGAIQGLLTSGTTRTAGLLSNIDIGPTVLRQAALEVPGGILGQPATVVPASDSVGRLKWLERVASRNFGIQIPVLVSVAVLALIVMTLSELTIRYRARFSKLRGVLSVLLLGLMAQPLAYLFIGRMEITGLAYACALIGITLVLLAVTYGIVLAIPRLRAAGSCSPLVALCLLTSVIVCCDVLLKTPLLKFSIVSCDQICGIRYYGMGNEYMGLVIIVSLLAPALLIRKKELSGRVDSSSMPLIAFLSVWFAVVSWIIGYPRLGANVGGLATAVPVFGIALVAWSGARFTKRHYLMVSAIVILCVAVFGLVDLRYSLGTSSHLGRTLALAGVYGWPYLWTLVSGKMMMHLAIMKTPQAYLTLIGGVPLLLMYRQRIKSEAELKGVSDPLIRLALPAVIVGIIVAILLNDSGIVPAAFILAFYMASALYLRLREAQT